MKRFKIYWNKIKHLEGDLESQKPQGLSTDLTSDLFSILILLRKPQNEDEIKHLTNYFIIRLITILESYFSNWLVKLVDVYDLPYKQLYKKDIQKKVKEIKKKYASDPSVGKVVTSTVNFQDWKDVNKIFSSIITPDFLKTVRCPPMKYHKKNKYMENYDRFVRLFQDRHELVHNYSFQVNYTVNDLQDIYEATNFFIMRIEKIIAIKLFITKPEILKQENKFLFEWAESSLSQTK